MSVIWECLVSGSDACAQGHDCQHICTNNGVPYTCKCREGYVLNADHKSCSRKIIHFLNTFYFYLLRWIDWSSWRPEDRVRTWKSGTDVKKAGTDSDLPLLARGGQSDSKGYLSTPYQSKNVIGCWLVRALLHQTDIKERAMTKAGGWTAHVAFILAKKLHLNTQERLQQTAN